MILKHLIINNTAANATDTNNANSNAFNEKKKVFKNNVPFISAYQKLMV